MSHNVPCIFTRVCGTALASKACKSITTSQQCSLRRLSWKAARRHCVSQLPVPFSAHVWSSATLECMQEYQKFPAAVCRLRRLSRKQEPLRYGNWRSFGACPCPWSSARLNNIRGQRSFATAARCLRCNFSSTCAGAIVSGKVETSYTTVKRSRKRMHTKALLLLPRAL